MYTDHEWAEKGAHCIKPTRTPRREHWAAVSHVAEEVLMGYEDCGAGEQKGHTETNTAAPTCQGKGPGAGGGNV